VATDDNAVTTLARLVEKLTDENANLRKVAGETKQIWQSIDDLVERVAKLEESE
jgi:hypothetical protein